MIELKNLSKIYETKKNTVTALKNVSLIFENNNMTFILGKSGSGKSTLLNLLGGLDRPSSGQILIENKDMGNFSSNDYDDYRNTYVGFVFQDFNLIEDYNVYENIILSLKLQKKEINEDKINQLLEELELTNLKYRRVNELSGGQKQRVAIARALIKDPKIILADEPTGNLDSETGKQVFELLQKISKKRLVIIVSHDNDSANTYGDRIIEIKDGEIISDSMPIEKKESKNNVNNKFIHAKLPLKDGILLGIKSLKHKKVKLLFSIIIASIALLLFSLSFSVSTYNVPKAEANMLKKYGINFVQIEKKVYLSNQDFVGHSQELLNNDTEFINEKIVQKSFPIYTISNTKTNSYLNDFINLFKINMVESFEGPTQPYTFSSNAEFVVIDENNFNEKIIGNFPKKDNEILISNYIADLMIMYGIELDNTENEFEIKEIYRPKNYDDILNSKILFHIDGLGDVEISGIIDYDLSKFQELKELSDIPSYLREGKNIYLDLMQNSSTVYNKVFVNEKFIKRFNKTVDTLLSSDYRYQLSNNNIILHGYDYIIGYGYAGEPIEYFNGNEWVTKKLDKNQIVLNIRQLTEFDEKNYETTLKKYLENKNADETISLEKSFFVTYTSDLANKVIGQKFSLNISALDKKIVEKYNDLEVVGIIGLKSKNEQNTLLSKDLMGKYITKTFNNSGLLVYENNQQELEKLFTNFQLGNKYSIVTIYYDSTLGSIRTLNKFIKQFQSFSVLALLFSIMLMSNFIISSIEIQKKKIGILRALGSKKSDIVKIFMVESLIIAIFSAILASILFISSSNYLNNVLIGNTSLILEVFIVSPIIFIIIFIISFIISLISSILFVYKITKMKPIDAIFDR